MVYGPEILIVIGVIVAVWGLAAAYIVGYANGYFERKRDEKKQKRSNEDD